MDFRKNEHADWLTDRLSERQTVRETDCQRHRLSERQTVRETDCQRDRQRDVSQTSTQSQLLLIPVHEDQRLRQQLLRLGWRGRRPGVNLIKRFSFIANDEAL
jgi:hypothetical protein